MPDERVLLSLKSYIGDAVMTAPLVDLLSQRYPSLTVLTSGLAAQVLQASDGNRSFMPMQKGRAPWAVWQHALQLRKQRFSIAVLVNKSFRSALTIRLAGIPRRIGHSSEARNGLLTDVMPYDEKEFEAWSIAELAKPLGLAPGQERPRLRVTEEEARVGRERIAGGTVAIQPGARFPEKQLTLETTTKIAKSLQARGHKLVFVGGPEERADAERVAATLNDPVTDLVGRTSIRETMGALSELRLTLGSDTGVMHLAAGVGCPVVQVFGPTPADKWGHAYGRNRVLRAPEGKMDRVRAEDVLQAALEVLEEA